MNGMLAEFGLTRIDWQVLNVIQDTPDVTDTEVLSTLAANADTARLTAAIDTVLTHDWASRPAPERLALSPEGAQHLGSPRVRWRLDQEGRSSHGSEIPLLCGATPAGGGDGRRRA
jgi:hypothetical protein